MLGQETTKILVVDDDMRLRSLLERYLVEQGYIVRSVANFEQMTRLMERENFHLVVLDLMLPGEDGLSICRKLRQQENEIPIIMLTAKGDDIDKVLGLELGADDYGMKSYVFVVLKTGSNTTTDKDFISSCFKEVAIFHTPFSWVHTELRSLYQYRSRHQYQWLSLVLQYHLKLC